MSQNAPLVLIAGPLNDAATQPLMDRYQVHRIARSLPELIDPEIARSIRALAVQGGATAALFKALPALEICASFGVGYDGVDVIAAAAQGVIVTNTPDVLNDEVADTAIALLLNTLRDLPRAEAYLRRGDWERSGPYPLSRGSLRGRNVGIFGLGRIGQSIATRLAGFGVSIAYHNRRVVPGVPWPYHSSLLDLASACDTLICVAPATGTVRAIDSKILTALGPEGVLINIGRGSTVDETALIEALSTGTILAAGLDVFVEEPKVPQALLDLPNACLLPHVGSASVRCRAEMGRLVADNIISWLDSGVPLSPVEETSR